jgi:predicted transcriptional regulator
MKDTPETKILKAIKANPQSTIREIAKAAELSSVSLADYHLKALIRKGLIRKVNRWEILTD